MLMRGLGAEVERTPEAKGWPGRLSGRWSLRVQTDGAFAALQFENPANPDFHEQTTAVEIWEQMEGRVDAVVIGVGSAGTFTGIARAMKKRLKDVLMCCGGAAGQCAAGWGAGAASGGGDWSDDGSGDVRSQRVRPGGDGDG